jgi:hypothetical protein
MTKSSGRNKFLGQLISQELRWVFRIIVE